MDNLDKKRDSEFEEPELKLCAHCKTEIPRVKTKFKTRKFCSLRCNRRYFSLKRYHKIKNTPAYKEYRKDYYHQWLDKNRDKFNASMRKASLKYQQRKKEEKEQLNKQVKEQERVIQEQERVVKEQVIQPDSEQKQEIKEQFKQFKPIKEEDIDNGIL